MNYLLSSDGSVKAVVDHLALSLDDYGWKIHVFTLGYNGTYKLDDGTIHSATSWDMTKIIGLQS